MINSSTNISSLNRQKITVSYVLYLFINNIINIITPLVTHSTPPTHGLEQERDGVVLLDVVVTDDRLLLGFLCWHRDHLPLVDQLDPLDFGEPKLVLAVLHQLVDGILNFDEHSCLGAIECLDKDLGWFELGIGVHGVVVVVRTWLLLVVEVEELHVLVSADHFLKNDASFRKTRGAVGPRRALHGTVDALLGEWHHAL